MACLIVVMDSFVEYVVKWQWLAVEFDLDSRISLRVESLTETIQYLGRGSLVAHPSKDSKLC